MSEIELLEAGELDRRITLYTNEDVLGATYGDSTESPVTLASVWASVRYLAGRELYLARQISGEISVEFKIRYRSDVTTKCSIGYGSLTFDIVQIAEIGRRAGLLIYAKARAAE